MTGKLPSQTQERLVALGEHIRLVRRARGISRQKLAESIGMHIGNYAKIERGTKNVTYDTLLRIADGLGVELTVKLVGRRKKKASPT